MNVFARCEACRAEEGTDPRSMLVIWEAAAVVWTCPACGQVGAEGIELAAWALSFGATETSGRRPAELRDVRRRSGGPALTAEYVDEWAAKLLGLDRSNEQRVLAALARSVEAPPSGWQQLMAAIASTTEWEDEEEQ